MKTINSKTEKVKKHNSRGGVALFIILTVVVIAAGVTSYIGGKGIAEGLNSAGEFINENLIQFFVRKGPVQITGGNIIELDTISGTSFAVCDNKLIKCSADGICMYNAEGIKKVIKTINLKNPLIASNNDAFVIASLDTNKIYYYKKQEEKWTADISGKIINISLGENGFVFVIYKKAGYTSGVDIYDSKGAFIRSTGYADRHMLSAGISPENDIMYILSISSKGTKITSHIEFYKILEKESFSGFIYEDMLVLNVKWARGQNAIGIFDSLMQFYFYDNGNYKKEWEKEYNDILSAGIIEDDIIYTVLKNDNPASENKVETSFYDLKGNEKGQFNLDEETVNVRTYSNLAAVNTGRELYLLNSSGKLISKYSSKSDIIDVLFFSKMKAALIKKNEVEIISIK